MLNKTSAIKTVHVETCVRNKNKKRVESPTLIVRTHAGWLLSFYVMLYHNHSVTFLDQELPIWSCTHTYLAANMWNITLLINVGTDSTPGLLCTCVYNNMI